MALHSAANNVVRTSIPSESETDPRATARCRRMIFARGYARQPPAPAQDRFGPPVRRLADTTAARRYRRPSGKFRISTHYSNPQNAQRPTTSGLQRSNPPWLRRLYRNLNSRETILENARQRKRDENNAREGDTVRSARRKRCAPGPIMAPSCASVSSSVMAARLCEALHAPSSQVNSTVLPPRSLASRLIRSTASEVAPAMVRPAVHSPDIGRRMPIRMDSFAPNVADSAETGQADKNEQNPQTT